MTDDRPPRPDPIEPDPDAIPEDLRDKEQWICWRYQWRDDREEWSKIPTDPTTGRNASTTDPDTWATCETAVEYHTDDVTATDGLGFVFDKNGVHMGVDLDDCRDADTGDLDPWAREVLDRAGTYAEVSPSRTGLHLIGNGFVPEGGNRGDVPDAEGHVEMYDSGRFFTVTGARVGDAEDVATIHREVKAIHAEYIAPDPDKSPETPAVDTGPPDANPGVEGDSSRSLDLDDDELLEKAKNAENGDKFTRLWNGRTSGYPSHSEARQALANLLAFWTGGDEKQMLRLFRESDLYRDDDDLRTFENYEIPTALSGRTDFYDPGAEDTNQASADGGVTATDTTDGDGPIPMSKAAVAARAGVENLGDLEDRQVAHYVWLMLKDHADTHVRVMQPQESLWACEGGVWEPTGERELRASAKRILMDSFGKNILSELIANVKGDRSVWADKDEFGLSPGTLTVENGLLDLRKAHAGDDDALRELRPDDKALTRLPVKYDPNAEFQEWADYVDEWAEDGRADALQEYAGYCLHIGEIPIHRALLLVGTGANGKGTFLSVIRTLLGRENTTSIELQTLANERDAVAEFYGSIANIDDDLSARKLGAGLGMFKKLVAGDRVRARRLYEDGFEFDATGKHLYAANEVPNVDVDDEDEAFWRRWLLVEFPNHYPPSDRDPTLRDRLTDPDRLSGVLNWAIEGWARLLEQGYFTGEERYAHEKRERWQAWGDSVDEFISEHVENDPTADRLTTADAYHHYRAWCQENDKDPVGQRQFTNSLKSENVGYKSSLRIDGSVERGYDELGLSGDVPDLDTTDDDGDHDDGQRQLTGPRDRADRITQWVRDAEDEELTYTELLAKADKAGMEREEFDHALQKARERGDLYEHKGDTYRAT